MEFKMIDIEKHRQTAADFRRDSFAVSFKDTSGFDEKEYLQWLNEKIKEFPDGFVMVEEEGKPIGQLELSIREYGGQLIGYVHLYYLAPHFRDRGLGKEMHRYALQFFKRHGEIEYHLRVSPTNVRARKFYEGIGMKEMGPELDGKVIRMKGELGE